MCNSDCRFDKRHVFVYHNNSTVSISCSWNGSDVYGSAGFIFGVIVKDPNAKCLMRSARVLTISSASKEPECITFSLFQDWCSKLTNVTEVTKANNRITTSVEIPVQSLYNVTYMYNGTTNNAVILLYWMPQFYGQDSNKGYRQCIVQVHILGKC